MRRLSKNEAGFGAVGIVLVIIIIVLIGVAGWLVYKHDHKSTNSNTSTNSSTSKQSKTSSRQPQITKSDVTKLVTNFYERYKSCSSYSVCETDTVKQYGTANLLSYYQPQTGKYPEDPILCAQAEPVGFDVLGVTITPTTASGTVAERFDASVSDVKFTITNKSGSLKLDTITCNPPAKATTVPN